MDIVGKGHELVLISKLVLVLVGFDEEGGHFCWSLLEELSSERNKLVLRDSLVSVCSSDNSCFLLKLFPVGMRLETGVWLTIWVGFACLFYLVRCALCPELCFCSGSGSSGPLVKSHGASCKSTLLAHELVHVLGEVVVFVFGDDFVLVDVSSIDILEALFSIEWIGLGEILFHLVGSNLFDSEWEVASLENFLPFFLD